MLVTHEVGAQVRRNTSATGRSRSPSRARRSRRRSCTSTTTAAPSGMRAFLSRQGSRSRRLAQHPARVQDARRVRDGRARLLQQRGRDVVSPKHALFTSGPLRSMGAACCHVRTCSVAGQRHVLEARARRPRTSRRATSRSCRCGPPTRSTGALIDEAHARALTQHAADARRADRRTTATLHKNMETLRGIQAFFAGGGQGRARGQRAAPGRRRLREPRRQRARAQRLCARAARQPQRHAARSSASTRWCRAWPSTRRASSWGGTWCWSSSSRPECVRACARACVCVCVYHLGAFG